jgi:hypothetical protein
MIKYYIHGIKGNSVNIGHIRRKEHVEESPLGAPLGCLSEMTSRLRFDSSKYSKKHSAEVDIGGKNTE